MKLYCLHEQSMRICCDGQKIENLVLHNMVIFLGNRFSAIPFYVR